MKLIKHFELIHRFELRPFAGRQCGEANVILGERNPWRGDLLRTERACERASGQNRHKSQQQRGATTHSVLQGEIGAKVQNFTAKGTGILACETLARLTRSGSLIYYSRRVEICTVRAFSPC